ncbi:MAG: (Fe-S)-binding protein, partial [Acidimicrobiia bacterium]|nr:(Fe-S)-binding protein [Acidimicrobiia bacterium]
TCCGALAAHAGYASDAEDMAMRNIDAMGDADVIVADVAGCGAHLRTYQRHGEAGRLVASKVVDVNDLVARAIEDGRLPVFESHGSLVGVQDPCHLEHGLRSHTAVDVVVTAAGFVPVPIDRGGLCCGAAGSYQLEHPEMASELGRRKAAAVSASGVSLVASANAGCEMQLRRFVGGGVGVVHPIELYAEALDRSGRG